MYPVFLGQIMFNPHFFTVNSYEIPKPSPVRSQFFWLKYIYLLSIHIYIWYYAYNHIYTYIANYYIEYIYIYIYYIHQRYKSHVWSTLKPRAATRVTMTATYRNGWVATFLAAGISSLVKLLQTMRALNVGWWWTGDMANSDSPYMYRYMIIYKYI